MTSIILICIAVYILNGLIFVETIFLEMKGSLEANQLEKYCILSSYERQTSGLRPLITGTYLCGKVSV